MKQRALKKQEKECFVVDGACKGKLKFYESTDDDTDYYYCDICSQIYEHFGEGEVDVRQGKFLTKIRVDSFL